MELFLASSCNISSIYEIDEDSRLCKRLEIPEKNTENLQGGWLAAELDGLLVEEAISSIQEANAAFAAKTHWELSPSEERLGRWVRIALQ